MASFTAALAPCLRGKHVFIKLFILWIRFVKGFKRFYPSVETRFNILFENFRFKCSEQCVKWARILKPNGHNLATWISCNWQWLQYIWDPMLTRQDKYGASQVFSTSPAHPHSSFRYYQQVSKFCVVCYMLYLVVRPLCASIAKRTAAPSAVNNVF